MIEQVAGERPSCRDPAALARRLRTDDTCAVHPEETPARSPDRRRRRTAFRCGVRRQSGCFGTARSLAIARSFRFRPDLCLNLHGGTRSMWMTAGIDGTRTGGFRAPQRHLDL